MANSYRGACVGALIASMALGVSVAQGATNYVIPWYVNPALRAEVWMGDDAAQVTTLNVDATGKYLAVGAEATEALANVQLYTTEELATATAVISNQFTDRVISQDAGLGTAPIVAVNGAIDTVLAVNPDLSAGVRMADAAIRWIGRFAPAATTFGAADTVSVFVFNTAGTAAWANSTAEGRTGLVVEWTISNGAFAKGREIATGLSVVKGLGVYTLEGVEYVVVGEGDAVATTAGTVKLVKTADGTVTTFVTDAEHLGAGIVSLRMSHTDYFRPRLYALLATGDIACYYCRPEKTPTEVVWSRTASNADLLAAANAPWTAEHAKITAFEVFPDGGTAAVAYRRHADDATEATGPVRLALLKHKQRKWIIYEKDDEGNPRQGVQRTLTDGVWQLNFSWGNNGDVWLGFNNGVSGSVWVNDEIQEYLDFSEGVVYKPSGDGPYKLHGNYMWSLGTNDVSNWRGPRVLVHSPNMSNFSDKAKGWAGEGNYEEVVIDTTVSSISSWSGPSVNQMRLIYKLPNLKTGSYCMIYPNHGKHYGEQSRFEDQDFSSMTHALDRSFQNWDATGVLTLPKIYCLSNACFRECVNMTEAILGAQNNQEFKLYNTAFYKCKSLKRVSFGGGPAGIYFDASNVFTDCPLEEVELTGGAVTCKDGLTTLWPDKAAETIVFAVPRDSETWKAILADSSKLKKRFTIAEQEAFFKTHPNRFLPIGVIDKSVLKTNHDQLIAYNDARGGYAVTIAKDEFFDDQVEVTSDRAATTDGRFMPGTTVTLTAKKGATGIFRRWYGDVPQADADKESITFTLNENRWIYCRFVHPWTLSADKKTASNGNFTINCAVHNEGNRQLEIGKGEWGGIYAADDAGVGVCDLGGPVYQEGDATPWTFVEWNSAGTGGFMVGTKHGKGAAHTLLTPGTMNTLVSGQFLHWSSRTEEARSYETFIFDEPTMTGTWGGWITCGQFDLTRMILRLPKLGAFSGDGGFWQTSLIDTKFDWWDLSGLTYLGGSSWAAPDWNTWAPASGVLTLPALRTLSTNAVGRAPLFNLHNVEEIVLGGKTKSDTVTLIGNKAFYGDRSLRKLAIYNDADVVVEKNILNGTTALREVWFQGPAPSETAFDNFFEKVMAAEAKPLKVYVSRMMPGWTTTGYLDYNPSDAEKAEAVGEPVFAVYRGGAAAPSGKELLLPRAGVYDPKGTYIIFR